MENLQKNINKNGKKTLNETLKPNSMGCYQREIESWKGKKIRMKKWHWIHVLGILFQVLMY